jgi:hypothetical protein
VTLGITALRTTGQTPCFIQVSASPTTCTGTRSNGLAAIPYEDIQFSWNFGDSSGSEVFTNPGVGSGSKNLNTAQIGPEAVYCYRTGGSFFVTLTATWWAGTGYASATTTQSITVTQFSALAANTYYIDNVNGLDSWSGKLAVPTPSVSPTDGPKATMQTGMVAIMAAIPASTNVSISLAQGCVWNESFGIKFPNFSSGAGAVSGVRIKSYIGLSGAGAQPQVNVTSGSNNPLSFGAAGGSTTKSDLVVSGIYFSTTGTASAVNVVAGDNAGSVGTMNYIALDNVTAYNALNISGGMTLLYQGPNTNGFWVYGGSYTSGIFSANGNRHSIYTSISTWQTILGCETAGSGSNAILDHHIYPHCQIHSIYRWITFGQTGTGANQRSFCINTDWEGTDTAPAQCQFLHMVENSVGNTQYFFDLGNATNDAYQVQFLNAVVERNAISGLTNGGTVFACGQTVTFRDNQLSSTKMSFLAPTANVAGILQLAVYRNTANSPTGTGGFVQFGGGFNPMVFNTTSPTVVINSTGATRIGMMNNMPVRLFSTTGSYPAPFTAGTIYYASVNSEVDQLAATPTFPSSGSTISLSSGTWSQNCPVIFAVSVGSLPAGVTPGLTYYWTPLSISTGTISATAGGSPLSFTGAGTGTQTMTSLSGTGIVLSATNGGAAIQPTSVGGGTLYLYPVWSQPLIMTDNNFNSSVSNAIAASIDFVDQQNAGAFIDRNIWTFLLSTTPFQNLHLQTTANDNFATWQAAGFDVHGSFAV